MLRAPHISSVIILILGSMFWAGCGGGKDPDLPETVAATGIVTYQGNPVSDATIMFYPVQGRKPASGKSDAAGKFTLTTFSKNDGVIPGEHKVTVNAYESTPEGVSMKSSIPVKYTTPNTSPLMVTVSEAQPELTLELED